MGIAIGAEDHRSENTQIGQYHFAALRVLAKAKMGF
jgi:hypothetical protein